MKLFIYTGYNNKGMEPLFWCNNFSLKSESFFSQDIPQIIYV
jgi:hypothetical protein